MGVREIDRSLEQWEMGVKDMQRRVILAPTPRERERWYAILLLAQGWTAAAILAGSACQNAVASALSRRSLAEMLERDPHTIGRWASAFGEGGPRALIFEQTGGSPPRRFPSRYRLGRRLERAQQEELKEAVLCNCQLGFIKSLGWQWDKTRRTDPARISRVWTLLALAYGTRVEDAQDRRIAPGNLGRRPRLWLPITGTLGAVRRAPSA